MKKVFSSLGRSAMAILAVLAVSVLFSACVKNKDAGMNIPAAGLMAFNLAPDQESVVIKLSGNLLTHSPLGYTSFTGGYQNIYVGNRSVESFDYPETSPLASVDYTFDKDKYYSLFVVGANDHYRNVIAVDNLDSLQATTGNAYIRYINAITDSVNTPAIAIAAGSNSVVNENAAYASVSEFKPVSAGQVSIVVKNNSGIDAARTITVEPKTVYTVLLTGVPGATDETKKVQIRFVQNGTITEETGK